MDEYEEIVKKKPSWPVIYIEREKNKKQNI